MKKYIVIFLALVPCLAGAAPSSIRFQGRLTDAQGKPIVAKQGIDDGVNVKFELYGALTGNVPRLWGPIEQIVFSNDAGLFSTDIEVPLNVIANNNELFLQVSVNDGAGFKALTPRQKLSSVPYAMLSEYAVNAASASVASSVVDNGVSTAKIQDQAITQQKIKDGAIGPEQLAGSLSGSFIPAGMIAMFDQSCPNGWTPFSQLDNRFPMGVPTYTGNGGGSAEITGLTAASAGAHAHTVNAHTHGAGTLITGPASNQDCQLKSAGGHCETPLNHTHRVTGGQTATSSPGTDTQGTHTHAISSDGSWLPPYMGVVFCRKD